MIAGAVIGGFWGLLLGAHIAGPPGLVVGLASGAGLGVFLGWLE